MYRLKHCTVPSHSAKVNDDEITLGLVFVLEEGGTRGKTQYSGQARLSCRNMVASPVGHTLTGLGGHLEIPSPSIQHDIDLFVSATVLGENKHVTHNMTQNCTL